MKRFFNPYLLATALFSLVFFTACDEEDGINLGGPDLTVDVQPADDAGVLTGNAGDEFTFFVDITTDDGFNVFRVMEVVDGNETLLFERPRMTAGTMSFDTTFDYTLKSSYMGQDVTLELMAVSDPGETTIEQFEINVEQSVVSFTAVLLYPPTADETSETFLDIENGLTYSVNDVEAAGGVSSSEIDLGYYYGQTNGPTLMAPASFPNVVGTTAPNYLLGDWNELNQTMIKRTTITTSEFVENDDNLSYILQAFDDGFSAGNDMMVTNLAVDDVLAFELEQDHGGNRGLIRVTALETGNDANDYIEVEVLVVK